MGPHVARSLFDAFRADRAAFLYSGQFHDDHTARLIALGEAAMEGVGARAAVRGRLAFIMVEAYQNIVRHRVPLPPQLEVGQGRSLFILRCGEQAQQVVAMNPVRRSDVPALREALHRLNGLDADQLKKMFLGGLRNEQSSARRGAGLGLIEMARRSGSDLGYMLRGLGPEHELFILAVRMGERSVPYEGILAEGAALHGTVVQQDLLVLHTGERTPSVDEALVRIVQHDERADPARAALFERLFLAASDGLRAVPGAGRWFFALARTGGHHQFTMGRLMPPEQAAELQRAVQELGRCDRVEVERRFRQALLRPRPDAAGTAVLELARAVVEPLSFTAEPGGDGVLGLFQAVV
ncbi:MAG: SiaB family protein kinase [Flavobacteriales bacterium]